MLEDVDNLPAKSSSPEPPPKSFGQKAWDYAKSRLNADNRFGSVVNSLLLYVNYQGLMAARTRKVHGAPAPDHLRAFSAQSQLAENSWAFFSARGGKFPEGDTVVQRIMNTLRHPQTSSTQFGWLFLSPGAMASNYSHVIAGLKAYGIGLKPGEVAYKQEKIRLYSGLYQATAFMLSGVGHFKKHEKDTSINEIKAEMSEEKAVSTKNNRNLLSIMREIWRHDRILLTSTLMTMFSPLLGGTESWMKSEKSRTEAIHLARGALVSGLIIASQGIYTMQRIVRSNYRGKHEEAPVEILQDELEETKGQQPPPEELGRKFTERLIAELPASREKIRQ